MFYLQRSHGLLNLSAHSNIIVSSSVWGGRQNMAAFLPLRWFTSLLCSTELCSTELCSPDEKTLTYLFHPERCLLCYLLVTVYNRLHFSCRWLHHPNGNTLSGLGVQYWHPCPLFSKCGSAEMNMRKLVPLLSTASAFESFHNILSVISSGVSLHITSEGGLAFFHMVRNHTVWVSYELPNYFWYLMLKWD